MKPLTFLLCASCFFSTFFSRASAAGVNVLTYHNDNGRTGQNLNEALLSPANVKTNTFGKLVSYPVDGYVYAQPLYVSALNIPGKGTHNVLFIATEHDSVYAFDADSNVWPTNGLLWKINLGISAVTPNSDFGNRYGNYHDINPEVGITGTPVIDLVAGTLYVDAFTHEGSAYFHRLHALSITTGAERPNSPVLVTASVPGVGVGSSNGVLVLDHKQSLQRAALTLAGGILYVVYTGYADTNPYHGWVVGFDPTTLQQLPNYVFNTTPNSTTAIFGANAGEGGIWMGGNGLAVDANTNLFFEVGNGSFSATNGSGGTEYGDTFIRLSTSKGLGVDDYFTPYNQATLAANDTDLGSGGLMLLPNQPGPYPHLLVGAGKEGKIYVINRDQMTTNNTHYNATGSSDPILQSVAGKIGGSFDTPAYFSGMIYYAGSNDKLKAFSLTSGVLSANPVSVGPRTYTNSFHGATPCVSANGANNGIIWATANGNPGVLAAYNPTNLTNEIYNSSQAGTRDLITNGVKFTLPTIANGKVYVGGQYAVSVFGLLDPSAIWRLAHFGANATNSAIAGDLADPDGDGAVNLLEYALASDPNVPNSSRSPTIALAGNHVQLYFQRNASASDLTYVLQTSASLSTWAALITYTVGSGWVANAPGATVAESPPFGVPPDQYVNVTVDFSSPSAVSQFLRLNVHR